MKLDDYLKIRRYVEFGLWVLLFSIVFLSETAVDFIDSERMGLGHQSWELVTLKGTSVFALLLLIPVILYFDHRCPIKWTNLNRSIPQHILFSLVFSFLHVTIMVGLRKIIYEFNDSYYDISNLIEQFGYEYLKDSQTYALLLAFIYLYRHIILRLQGEASLLGNAEPSSTTGTPNGGPAGSPDKPKRMLVKKLGREFLIVIKDVERIEACGNYVNLHIAKRVYPLRETMGNIEKRLDDTRFKRIHRSHIINLDYLQEIIPLESGDAQVVMKSTDILPMSRTYRSVVHEFA